MDENDDTVLPTNNGGATTDMRLLSPFYYLAICHL